MARSEGGSATVEFALVLPLLVLVVLAVAEVAVIGRTQLELVNSAREGVRIAAVNPEPADAVQAALEPLGEASELARVSVSRPSVVGEPARVTVILRHTVAPFLFGGMDLSLRASAVMRVER